MHTEIWILLSLFYDVVLAVGHGKYAGNVDVFWNFHKRLGVNNLFFLVWVSFALPCFDRAPIISEIIDRRWV